MEKNEKEMMVIAKEDLLVALQILDQITVKGTNNCRAVAYVDRLLRTAKEEPKEKEEEVK